MHLEKQYKIFVVLDKLAFLHEVLENMPLIVNIDKNMSHEMGKVFAHRSTVDVKSKVAAMGESKSVTASQINRHDPHLHKLMELIYVNIKKRFQMFNNAFCYLDFKGRDGVSLQDWTRGLDGFSIKILPRDAKLVFQYLTDSDGGAKVLMTQDEFMRLHTERKRRNIDPFELQVFHEEQSASLKEYMNLVQSDNAKKDLEALS
jgi:hypothetical protein